jgi:hypothetical protein
MKKKNELVRLFTTASVDEESTPKLHCRRYNQMPISKGLELYQIIETRRGRSSKQS